MYYTESDGVSLLGREVRFICVVSNQACFAEFI